MNEFHLNKKFPALTVACSTRADGNMSYHWGDAAEVTANRETFLGHHGIPIEQCIASNLVHKDRILEMHKKDIGRGARGKRSFQCDGAYTIEAGLYHFFSVADCLPIILYSPSRHIIGFVHAGWRGTEMQVVKKYVERICEEFDMGRSQLWAEIGPGIRPCCYHVHNPTQKLLQGWEPYLKEIDQNVTAVDIVGYNIQQLQDTGIPASQILDTNICTSCRSDIYFSHYRDTREKRPEGRFAVVVGLNR